MRTASDDMIQGMREFLNAQPGMTTKSIEDAVDTLKKYRNDPVNHFLLQLNANLIN